MMRLHKVYHRLTLLSLSPSSPPPPPALTSSLSLFTPVRTPGHLRTHHSKRFKSICTMSSRFPNLVPLNSIAAENVGGRSNDSVSSASTEDEGARYFSHQFFFLQVLV
jgi:hypothetical protein